MITKLAALFALALPLSAAAQPTEAERALRPTFTAQAQWDRYLAAAVATRQRFYAQLARTGVAYGDEPGPLTIVSVEAATAEQLGVDEIAVRSVQVGDVLLVSGNRLAVVYDASPCASRYDLFAPVLVGNMRGVFLAVPEGRRRGRLALRDCSPCASGGAAPRYPREVGLYVLPAGAVYGGVLSVPIQDTRPRLDWRSCGPRP